MSRRNRRSYPITNYLKKSTLTFLIILLAWILFQLAENFHFSKPSKIPGSDAPVELYSNQTGDDLTQLYQQAIANAKQSVTLAMYSLSDYTILGALQKKLDEGIPVYIVCDAEACKDFSRRMPRATIIKRSSQGLMHQKILIIDQRYIWLGSANLTFSSLNVHGNLVIGLDNPAMAQALTQRIKSMDVAGDKTPLMHQVTTAGPQQVELWVLPDDPHAVKKMTELFRAAKKSIKVAMFTWTRTDFAQELIAAAKRGVRVEVVIDQNQGKGASAKIVRMLKEGGIPVRLSKGHGLLHHKFADIDDNILVNGSANWTNNAFRYNDDYFLIVEPLTTEQRTKMDQLYQVILKQSEPAK